MRANRWGLVTLLALTATVSYLCRVNVSVAGALMMRELGISPVEMGRVFSALILGYGLFQVPAGMMADRWGARRMLLFACLGWTVATVLMAATGWGPLSRATASSLWVLIFLRFTLGIAQAPTYPAAAQGVAQWIPPYRQGLANSIVLTSIGLGSGLAPPFLSTIMVHWGWRAAMLSSAIPALAVAIAWSMVPEDVPRIPTRPAPTSAANDRGRLRSSSFVFLVVSYTLEGYVGYVFIFWFYLYLVQERHFDLLKAGKLSSLPWILCVVSIPLGGVVSDRLVSGRLGLGWGRRAVPIFGLAFAGIFVAGGARTPNAYSAVVCLALATALIFCVEGPFWAAMMEVAGSNTGTAGGVMNFGANIGGFISPALTPILAAHWGWKNALYVAAAISLISAALWLGVSPRSDQDGARELPPREEVMI
jgi:ACS family glucarate transporter-like MFS transporter